MEPEATGNKSFLHPLLSPKHNQWTEEIETHLKNHTPSDDPARLQEWLEEPIEDHEC